MTKPLPFRVAFFAGVAGLAACSGYEFTLNERPLYTPKPLFSEYHVEDRALKDCVRQTIADKQVREAEELEVLVCTSAGITSLTGLAIFSEVRQLNLANNVITELEPLARMPELRRLDLSGNAVKSVAPLWTLAHLEEVNLEDNAALDCGEAAQLKEKTSARVRLPDHCQ